MIGDNHFDHQAGGDRQDYDHQQEHPAKPAPDGLTDWDSLKVSQDFEPLTGTKILTTVPVRKPHRQWFFQTHPSAEWHYPAYTLEDQEDGQLYLVDRPLWSVLDGEIVFKTMVAAVNRQGTFFFWPVRMSSPNGRKDEWGRTAREFAKMAMGKWVRVTPNMDLGAYQVTVARGGPEAVWPNLEFPKLLEIAFRDKIIRDFDHPLLKRLRGEL